MLAGSNYQSEAINFDEYLNFDKDEVEDIIIIEASTIPVSPNFSELYNQAIAEGLNPGKLTKTILRAANHLHPYIAHA